MWTFTKQRSYNAIDAKDFLKLMNEIFSIPVDLFLLLFDVNCDCSGVEPMSLIRRAACTRIERLVCLL